MDDAATDAALQAELDNAKTELDTVRRELERALRRVNDATVTELTTALTTCKAELDNTRTELGKPLERKVFVSQELEIARADARRKEDLHTSWGCPWRRCPHRCISGLFAGPQARPSNSAPKKMIQFALTSKSRLCKLCRQGKREIISI